MSHLLIVRPGVACGNKGVRSAETPARSGRADPPDFSRERGSRLNEKARSDALEYPLPNAYWSPAMPLFESSDTRTAGRTDIRSRKRRFDLGRLRPADLFDAWLFAEADASLALSAWMSAGRAEKGDAHAAYVAALDREAHAAAVLQHRLGLA
jgi:hypothetical protein